MTTTTITTLRKPPKLTDTTMRMTPTMIMSSLRRPMRNTIVLSRFYLLNFLFSFNFLFVCLLCFVADNLRALSLY